MKFTATTAIFTAAALPSLIAAQASDPNYPLLEQPLVPLPRDQCKSFPGYTNENTPGSNFLVAVDGTTSEVNGYYLSPQVEDLQLHMQNATVLIASTEKTIAKQGLRCNPVANHQLEAFAHQGDGTYKWVPLGLANQTYDAGLSYGFVSSAPIRGYQGPDGKSVFLGAGNTTTWGIHKTRAFGADVYDYYNVRLLAPGSDLPWSNTPIAVGEQGARIKVAFSI